MEPAPPIDLTNPFYRLNHGAISHTVPVIDYTWTERLQYEQAAEPRSGNHIPYLSEGEAQWGVLRRGCSAPTESPYRDTECCICTRCKLVYWNQRIPQHLYDYTPSLNVPDTGRMSTQKRDLDLPDGDETDEESDEESETLAHTRMLMRVDMPDIQLY